MTDKKLTNEDFQHEWYDLQMRHDQQLVTIRKEFDDKLSDAEFSHMENLKELLHRADKAGCTLTKFAPPERHATMIKPLTGIATHECERLQLNGYDNIAIVSPNEFPLLRIYNKDGQIDQAVMISYCPFCGMSLLQDNPTLKTEIDSRLNEIHKYYGR